MSAPVVSPVTAAEDPPRLQPLLVRRVSEYFVADGVATAISLVGIIVVVRSVSVEDFGIADFVRSIQLLVAGMVGLNLFDAAGRFYFETGDTEERRRILGGGLTASLVTGIAAALVLGALLPVWQRLSALELGTGIVWLGALGIPANNMVMAVTQTAVVRKASRLYAALVVTQACLSVAGILVLVVWAGAGLEGYLVALLVSATLTAAVGYALQASEYRWGWPRSLRASLAFSAPFTITGMLQYGHGVFVRVMLAELAPAAALGWYALAERIQAPLKLVISAAGKVWLPWLFTAQPPARAAIGRLVFRLNGIVLAVQAIVIAFLPEVIRLVGGESYAPAYTTAVLLLVAAWVYFFGDWIVSGSLAVARQTSSRVIVHLAAVGIAVPVTVVGVALWGSAGAALSVLTGSIVVLLGMLRAGSIAYPLRYGLPRLLPASALVMVFAIGASVQGNLGMKLFLLAVGGGLWALGLISAPAGKDAHA